MSNSIFAWASLCGFFVFILLILAVFAVAVYFILRNAKTLTADVHQSWQEFARARGLTYELIPGTARPKLSGMYRDRPITLVIAHPSRRAWDTLVTTPVSPSHDLQLAITPRTSLDWMSSGQEIAFGTEEFRTEYRVIGTVPPSALAHLNSSVQSAIQASGIKLLRLDKGTLTISIRGFETRPQALEDFLTLACTVAEALEQ